MLSSTLPRWLALVLTGLTMYSQVVGQSANREPWRRSQLEGSPPIFSRSEPSSINRIPEPGRGARPAANLPEWSIGNPTDEEQKLIELINRARANPSNEAVRLRQLADPDVQAAYVGLGVDLNSFAADLNTRPAAPPLTPEVRLMTAARGHTKYQFDNAVQSHSQTNFVTGQWLNNLEQRLDALQYPWAMLRENVYTFAANMEQTHAAFEVDWGDGPGGQQSPPAHRNNNHATTVTEIGVGVIAGFNTVAHATETNTVGPRVVTINYGRTHSRPNYVTGVAYVDVNGDGEYDEGEGLPGVRVDVSGASHFAKTAISGGFAVPTPSGTHTVSFSAPGLTTTARSITITNDTVKLDLALPFASPALQGAPTPSVGFANAYVPSPFPGATHMEWRALQRLAFNAVLGAEAGVDGFTAVTTGTYTARSIAFRSSGVASYRLVNATGRPQFLNQNQELFSGANSTLRFKWRFGVSTTDSIANADISTDNGNNWTTVWSRRGLGENVTPSPTFQSESISLNLPPQIPFLVRFRYSVPPGGAFYDAASDERIGFFFDEVSYTDTSMIQPTASGEIAADGVIGFTPPTSGTYLLQARPKIGTRVFPYRGTTSVMAQSGPAPVGVSRISSAVIDPSGNLRVDFSLLVGTSTTFELERSSDLGTSWTRDASAVLSNNGGGKFTFRTTTLEAQGFVRIRAR